MVAWFVAEHRLSGALAVAVGVLGLSSTGSIFVGHKLSCSMACQIFLDKGLDQCLLHWQADSLLLS